MEQYPPVLLGDLDALPRRHDAIDPASPHLLLRRGGHVHRRALPGRLPLVVGPRVVERVRRDPPPVALRIASHVHEAGAAREHHEAALESPGRACLMIDPLQLGVADGGEEPAPEARRPARPPPPASRATTCTRTRRRGAPRSPPRRSPARRPTRTCRGRPRTAARAWCGRRAARADRSGGRPWRASLRVLSAPRRARQSARACRPGSRLLALAGVCRMSLLPLAGRTGVVTGASSGIGRALTLRLVARGMRVVA